MRCSELSRTVDQNDEWSLSVVEVARGVSWRHRKGFINQSSEIAGQARNDDASIAFVLFI